MSIRPLKARTICLALVTCLGAACGHGATHTAPTTAAQQAIAPTPSPAHQAVGEEVSYRAGDTELKGYLAYPKDVTDKRPGVLVVHEWWGLNEYARTRARMLAELGYVALAVDIYGGGRSAEHPADATALMNAAMSQPEEVARRMQAGRELLAGHALVEPTKLAAIGYCMGGALVLGAARKGADFDLVGSFHGSYATQTPLQKGTFAGKIFIAHGAADSFSPPAQVAALKAELDAADANYEFVAYEGAKHGFSNPAATATGEREGMDIAYDAKADSQSWSHLQELLQSAFAAP